MRVVRGLLATVALVVGSVWPAVVRAQDNEISSPSSLPARPARFERNPTTRHLQVSVSYRDVIDDDTRRKLQSGLPTVISFRGYFFAEGSGDDPKPVTGIFQSCRITYDVWNEVYMVHLVQPSGEMTRPALNMEGVLRRCAEVREMAIPGSLPVGGAYYLAGTVEVNPISQEMLEQIRRWVSRPPGSSAVTPGDSIFGSFVGLFVARIGKADRSMSFRTSGFTVPQ
jgi:hypothetical protein